MLADAALIRLRVAVEAEMNRRELAFSVGDVGEQLAIAHFNATPGFPTLLAAPTGTKNVDALSRDGERYSIKTLLKAKKPVLFTLPPSNLTANYSSGCWSFTSPRNTG